MGRQKPPKQQGVRILLRVLAVVGLLILVLLGGLCAFVYSEFPSIVNNMFPSMKPSSAQVEQFGKRLRLETEKRWQHRVEMERGTLVLEQAETDTPPHEFKQYKYLAYFRVRGTQARFACPFPVGERSDRLRDWGMFSSDLPSQEVEALAAYAKLKEPPPIMGDGSKDGARWQFTQLDLNATYMCGPEVVMKRGADGTFHVIGRH